MDRFSNAINDLYAKTKVPRIIPVPVTDIATALDYEVWDFKISPENEHISGAVLYQEKKIVLNPNDSDLRKIFTLAHEIGHIYLGHESDNSIIDTRRRIIDTRRSIETLNPTNRKEKDANEFAAELLMPEEDVKKAWKQYKSRYQLSNIFKVSMAAIVIRLEKLGIDYAQEGF